MENNNASSFARGNTRALEPWYQQKQQQQKSVLSTVMVVNRLPRMSWVVSAEICAPTAWQVHVEVNGLKPAPTPLLVFLAPTVLLLLLSLLVLLLFIINSAGTTIITTASTPPAVAGYAMPGVLLVHRGRSRNLLPYDAAGVQVGLWSAAPFLLRVHDKRGSSDVPAAH